MDSDGVRRLIVIPQTQYQQLIQNQTKATTATKPREKDDSGDKNEQNQCRTDRPEPSNTDESQMIVGQNGEDYDGLDDMDGKILQILQCSYPKTIMKKMRKLFLFVINFGGDILTFNRKGNVVIKGQVVEPKSNILDCLEAAVSDQYSEKPVGYRAFQHALEEINVPSKFYAGDKARGKWVKDKRAVCRWRPY